MTRHPSPPNDAARRYLEAHGKHLYHLLCEVALSGSLPAWMTLAAAGLGLELGSVLEAGEGAEEIESAGDRRSLEGR